MVRIANWERPFRIWQYSVSYSQLLLRSVNVNGFDSRIDVMFSNVEMMHLIPTMEHLEIDEAPFGEVSLVIPQLAPPVRGRIFLINGGSSYLYATHCEWHEDDGGPRTPSHFGPLQGTS